MFNLGSISATPHKSKAKQTALAINQPSKIQSLLISDISDRGIDLKYSTLDIPCPSTVSEEMWSEISYLCFQQASALYDSKNFLDAKNSLDDATDLLSMYDDDANNSIARLYAYVFWMMGKIFREMGYQDNDEAKIEKAKEYFTSSLNQYEMPQAYNSLGLLQQRQGNCEGSEQSYLAAIDLDNKYPLAHVNLALLYQDFFHYDLALEHFSKSIELDPGDASNYNSRGFLHLSMENYGLALEDFKSALAFGFQQAICTFKINLTQYLMGECEALNVPKEFLMANPKDAITLSAFYLKKDKFQEAIDILLFLHENNKENFWIAMNLSVAYCASNQYIDALDFLEQAIAISSKSFECLAENKEFPKIYLEKERLFQLNIYKNISKIMIFWEYWDEAVNALDKALTLCDLPVERDFLLFSKANVLFDQGKYVCAALTYKEISSDYHPELVRTYLFEAISNSNTDESSEVAVEVNKITRRHSLDGRINKNIENKYLNFVDSKKTQRRYMNGHTFFSPYRRDNGLCKNNYVFELYEIDSKWYKKKVGSISGYHRKWTAISNGTSRLANNTSVDAFIIDPFSNKILLSKEGHFDMAKACVKDGNVKFAGCIAFKDGEIVVWNNASGHFLPHADMAENAAGATGLPLDKFRARHILKERFENLIKECDRNYHLIAGKLPNTTGGTADTAESLYMSL